MTKAIEFGSPKYFDAIDRIKRAFDQLGTTIEPFDDALKAHNVELDPAGLLIINGEPYATDHPHYEQAHRFFSQVDAYTFIAVVASYAPFQSDTPYKSVIRYYLIASHGRYSPALNRTIYSIHDAFEHLRLSQPKKSGNYYSKEDADKATAKARSIMKKGSLTPDMKDKVIRLIEFMEVTLGRTKNLLTDLIKTGSQVDSGDRPA